MEEVSLVNFAIVLALVPICQGLVQMLKNDNFGAYVTRLLSLVVALGLVFLIREADIPGFSVSLENPYTAMLTGLVIALIAAGFYDSQKAGIVKSIAESEQDITVATEMVGIEKEKETKKTK
jgi:hypothetical protein